MKEDWKMVKLGEVCEIQNGYAFDSKCFSSESGMPLIRIRDIKRGYTETFYDGDYSSEYIVRKGDFLIGMDGEFNIGEWNSEDALLNQRVCKLIPNNKINVRFVYYYIPESLKRIESKTSFATVKHLSSKQIKEIEIPLPPLEEQHRIVGILDAAFAKIDALKANAEENLANAKALFQQVLAQELQPKEGWVEKKLGEVCEKIGSGATPHGGKDSYKEEGISLIRSLNVYDNEFIYDDLAHIDDKQADELNNVIIEKNDVLFNITGASVTRCCIVPNKILPARVNQHVSILRPQNGVLTNVFLCYLMISMKDYLIKLAFSKGATRQAITKKQLEDLMIAYPNDINEQMSIVNTINTLSEKCRRLEQVAQQTICECDALKQSILRKAFSGEL